jgi:hypothetical protein
MFEEAKEPPEKTLKQEGIHGRLLTIVHRDMSFAGVESETGGIAASL